MSPIALAPGFVQITESLALRPQRGRILVQIDEFAYSGRLIIPDTAKRKPTTGKVLAVGDGVEGIEIGDIVVYGLYSGTVLKFKNEPALRVLIPEEILAFKAGSAEIEHDAPQD